jgi:uncharacterized protein (TIGR02147 family)
MKIIVFEFQDYKEYLRNYIHQLPRQGYGFKSRMAQALNCKTSYITQVLHGQAHISLEYAETLNELLKHSDSESEYFLNLVNLCRAGTESLRRRINNRLLALKAKQGNLKERFNEKTDLNDTKIMEFFSLWYLNAIQIASTIPRLQSRKALKEALGISEHTLNEGLTFLVSNGLIQEKGNRLIPGQTKIFIGKDSSVLKVHHANWRQRAILSMDRSYTDDLHFTSVFSLSTKDVALIKERLIREIEQIRKIVKPSREEELHTCIVDFFRIDGK